MPGPALVGKTIKQIADERGDHKVHIFLDLALLDPAALKRAQLGRYAEAPFEALGGMQRVVNRNDGVVKATVIRGQVAFENDVPSPALGKQHGFGRFLPRVGDAQG